MIKTLTNLFKQDKEKFVVPKGVQDVIPVAAIFDDGIFKVGKDKYSKTYRFTDINYAVASREDKEAMFLEYSELLNSLDSGATTKITINNRRLNRLDFEQTILIPTTGDNLDEYREEYNKMLLDKATGANSIAQGEVIDDANRNEDKYAKRSSRTLDCYGYDDEMSSQFHKELAIMFDDPFERAEEERLELEREELRQCEIRKARIALSMLQPLQRERLMKNVCCGLSSRAIAKQEGVYYSSVDKSIAAAKKNFIKFYENL